MKSAHLHWLLELMVIDPLPLEWILPTFNGQHTNALPLPDYTLGDYSQLLISALRNGVIAFLSNDQPLKMEDAISSITAIAAARALEEPAAELRLCLTDAGGETWEGLAKPKWSRFFKSELTYNSSNLDDLGVSCLLASQNRDAVVAYLGWYERLESVDVRWDTLTISTPADYAATYWKKLAGIYEARFDGVRLRADRSVPTPVCDWKISLQDWHIKAWDRPDWS